VVFGRREFCAVLLSLGFFVCVYTVLLASRSPAQESDESSEPTGEETGISTTDIAIAKDDNPDPVEVGGFLLYTLEVANDTASSQDLIVADELPAGVDLIAVDEPSQGDCSEASNVVTCQVANLAPNETATVQILVEPEEEGTIVNLAQVFSASDPTTPIDEAEETTTVRGTGRAPILCRGGTCYGTNRADEIRGSNVRDLIYAKDGRDEVQGGYSGDKIYGGRGGDSLDGDFSSGSEEETTTGGNDWVYGGPGSDTLNGGPGNDYLRGAEGNDTIDAREFSDVGAGASGQDVVIGGSGDDTIEAVDLNPDQIYCGKGTDTVRYEPERDTLPSPEQCEDKEPIDASVP
jgi:Ca2+-binding RTX toxin-like protein